MVKVARMGSRSASAKTAHAADQRGGTADREANEVAFVIARVDDHAGLDGGEHRSLVLRDAQLGIDDGVGVKSRIDGREQRVECLRR